MALKSKLYLKPLTGSLLAMGLLSSTSVSAATNCSVSIDEPTTGDTFFALPGEYWCDISVAGSASVGAAGPSQKASFVYAIDVSGSTNSGGGTGCSPVLDCEKKFVKALNREVVNNPSINEVGIVTDRSSGGVADMSLAPGMQMVITPNVTDVNRVVDSIHGGGSSGCIAGIQNALTVVNNSTPNNKKIVVFISDGFCGNNNSSVSTIAAQLVAADAMIHSVATGSSSSCAGAMSQMATETGGQCFHVVNPGELPEIIPNLIGGTSLDDLCIQVDGGPCTPIADLDLPKTGPASIDYSTLAPNLNFWSSHHLCVTASCSELLGGDLSTESVTQCKTIYCDIDPYFY